jgi:hypothetical protein
MLSYSAGIWALGSQQSQQQHTSLMMCMMVELYLLFLLCRCL